MKFGIIVLFKLLLVFSVALPAEEFSLLTYNIAGLPDYISDSNPSRNTPIIGKRINAYDIVLVQEDFRYHGKLLRDNQHPYQSRYQSGGFSGYGDGLNQFSIFNFSKLLRIPWHDCSGLFNRKNDCLTPKGFTFSTQIIDQVEVHIYNLHMDAGRHQKDKIARELNAKQLVNFVKAHSVNQVIIIVGDFNLKHQDNDDLNIINYLLAELDLKMACRELNCTDEKIDKIMYRSGLSGRLELLDRKVLKQEFSDHRGDLSDHEPVLGIFEILKN